MTKTQKEVADTVIFPSSLDGQIKVSGGENGIIVKPITKAIPVELPVSLPLVKVNEITHGDSLELTGCVPAKADLILEDMPYNMTACKWDKEPIDLKKYWESRMELIKPTGVICLTASQPFTSELVISNKNMFKYEWIWKKNVASNFMQYKFMPARIHENILIFASGKTTYNAIMENKNPKSLERMKYKFKDRKATEHYNNKTMEDTSNRQEQMYPTSVKKFNREVGMHPTQKPVGLFEYLIRTYTNEGELVFDGFGGSGTTAIAAYRTKRNFIVIEKDKRYFEIASKRLYQERNPLSTFDEAS